MVVGLMFSCKAVLVAFMLLFILAFSVRNVNGFFTDDMVVLDSDAKSGHFTCVGVSLSRRNDSYPFADFYRLELSVACLSTAHSYDGPLEVVINVFLPLYAEDIGLSASPYGFYSQVSAYNQMEFHPEIVKLQNSCLVKWSVSSVKWFVAADWLFIDYVRFFLDFNVPENKTVTAYLAVATSYYSFNILGYSKVSDERIQWLRVKSSEEEQFEPENVKMPETPKTFLSPLGLNAILGACTAMIAASHYFVAVKKKPKNQNQTLPMQRRPLGVTLIALFNLLIAAPLCLILGPANIEWRPALAANLVAFGILNVINGLGLLKLKTWSWYTTIAINTLSMINDYILFPTPNAIIMPLEPFIIAYLLIRKSAFQIP
jgi:hypothetical protein